ncbi:hypothetical protein [Leisingera sp. ANG59]|uniref:hypothetical protein n=1 Tax=Leisingera sp. ANG59 TaxID=2675221 RepID=UPI001573248C|nr:hypothetical protein [Leisingera sp. ANG59]NSY41194.1 hypothetical protein [Leisingera sp. ANG59]
MVNGAKDRFEKQKARWLAEEPSFINRCWDALCFYRYAFPWVQFSWYKLPYVLAQLGLAASGPAIAYHTADKLEKWHAIYIFLGVLVVLVLAAFLSGTPERRAGRISKPIQTIWVRFGNLLNTVKSGATPSAQKNPSIEFTLALATSLAAQVTGIKQSEFAASLVLYDGDERVRMKIDHRDRGSDRPIGRQINDLETVLGHHACQSGAAPRVVADVKRFGKYGLKSPTQSRPNYRSIFLHPVTSVQKGSVAGFMSVDCTVPHAFHGHRADDLAALLEPLKAHIEEMI